MTKAELAVEEIGNLSEQLIKREWIRQSAAIITKHLGDGEDRELMDAIFSNSWELCSDRFGSWSVGRSSPDGWETISKHANLRKAIRAAIDAERKS